MDFWWLRLARIYPVHLVMLVVAGLAVVAQARVTGDALDRDWLTPWDFLKNLLLIQEWGPNPQRGWNFVAWSLSMEWLAYLIFPLLILLIFRLHRRVPTSLLAVIWVACLAPLLVYGSQTTDAYYTDNWGSTFRILCEFTAGAVTYVIIRRFLVDDQPGPRALAVANALSWLLPLAVVVATVVLSNLPAAQPPGERLLGDAEPLPPYFHLWLVPLLIAWLGALALARVRVRRACGRR